MITSAFPFIVLLIFLAGSLKLIESKSRLKIFQLVEERKRKRKFHFKNTLN